MRTESTRPAASSRLALVLAFAAIYIVWGSTYLAIRLVIDTLPPFLMIGLRFGVAGVLVLAWAGLRGAPPPSLGQLARSGGIGVLLLFGGTGSVVWATQYLDSGLVALLVSMEPLWLAALMMLWSGVDARPTRVTFAALGLGFAGAALLAAPGDVLGASGVHLPSLVALVVGSLSWAGGSLLSRNADLPVSAVVNSGVQMLGGASVLMLFGWLRGEWASFDPAGVSAASIGAFVYLVVFGSLLAFSAYVWLLRRVSPTLVSTHTYVNPVVAIFLGWLIVDETVNARTLVASGLILASVILITGAEATSSRRRRRQQRLVEVPLAAAAQVGAPADPVDRFDERVSDGLESPMQAPPPALGRAEDCRA